MSSFGWKLHGDGSTISSQSVVKPHERLSWPRTIGIGMQHVVAMFGATFLVPLLTGFPPATTLFFSAIGTMLFLVITGNRLPSYLGSSFALLAPIAAAKANWGPAYALGGVILTGATLAAVGLLVQVAGAKWIDIVMPPVVTGAVVGLIGFNLAPVAWTNFKASAGTASVTLFAILLVTVAFRGILGRLGILVGVLIGYGFAVTRGEVNFTAVKQAAWFGLPQFHAPAFSPGLIGLFVPVVLVLVAENVGHVKSVAAMTGKNYDHLVGRALLADGAATVLAGAGGGSGTTTYAENIGVMAATKVYSTAVYWVAGFTGLGLSMLPKFGELINTIPPGVLGGATTVLYGMIGMLGARIWVQHKVDFSDPVNLMSVAVAMVAGIANFTFVVGHFELAGIAVGSIGSVVVYHLMRALARWRGTSQEAASPASVPGGVELEKDENG